MAKAMAIVHQSTARKSGGVGGTTLGKGFDLTPVFFANGGWMACGLEVIFTDRTPSLAILYKV
jgi:hypothetical protein